MQLNSPNAKKWSSLENTASYIILLDLYVLSTVLAWKFLSLIVVSTDPDQRKFLFHMISFKSILCLISVTF